MPTYTATRKWQRWAGTLADLDRALNAAMEELRQWLGTEPRCYLSVALPELTMEFSKIEGLKTISNDIRKVKTIRFWPNLGGEGPKVDITIDDDSPAVSLEVKGNDRVRVEGLRTRLGDLLDKGYRRPRWYGDRSVIVIFGVILVWVLWAALVFGLESVAAIFHWPVPVQGNNVAVGPLVGCGVAAVALLVGVYWLFPPLELLGPGERTRYQRFRGAVYVVLLSVVSIIVAAPLVNILFGHSP